MNSRNTTALIFAATMALAGFLLFQVQLVLGKFILPWFGGSASTWLVCMLFFQVALLVGYAHAYAITLPLDHPPASPTADRHPCADTAALADRALRQLEARRCERSHMAHSGTAGGVRRLALYRARNDDAAAVALACAYRSRSQSRKILRRLEYRVVPGPALLSVLFRTLAAERGADTLVVLGLRAVCGTVCCLRCFSRSAARRTRKFPMRVRFGRATTILC